MYSNNTSLAQALILATALIGASSQIALAGFPICNTVTMGGEPIFSIKGSADGFSPEHRAQLAQDNLDNALATAPDCDPSLAKVERINGVLCVTLDGHLIVTPDTASANAENLTSEELAQEWADSIKSFLADRNRSLSYRNSLKGIHPIQASIAYTERRLYAPEGTVLPVIFEKPLASDSLKIGDLIVGKVNDDVPLGHFVIPNGSLVSGTVVESSAGRLTISFTELKTPSGTETPINAYIVDTYCTTNIKPHPVCTLSMPAGLHTAARVPAMIAIGTPKETTTEQLVFLPGSHFEIAPGQEVSVTLNQSTPVALIERNMAM